MEPCDVGGESGGGESEESEPLALDDEDGESPEDDDDDDESGLLASPESFSSSLACLAWSECGFELARSWLVLVFTHRGECKILERRARVVAEEEKGLFDRKSRWDGSNESVCLQVVARIQPANISLTVKS
jgi:hypothetical protein